MYKRGMGDGVHFRRSICCGVATRWMTRSVVLSGGVIILAVVFLTGCASNTIKEAAVTVIKISSEYKGRVCSAEYSSAKTVSGARVRWENTLKGCIFHLNAESVSPLEVITAIKDNNKEVLKTIREVMGDAGNMAMRGFAPPGGVGGTGEFSSSTITMPSGMVRGTEGE